MNEKLLASACVYSTSDREKVVGKSRVDLSSNNDCHLVAIFCNYS